MENKPEESNISENKNLTEPEFINEPKKCTTKTVELGARLRALAYIAKHFGARVCPIVDVKGGVLLDYYEILCKDNIDKDLINQLHASGFKIKEIKLSKLFDNMIILIVRINTLAVDFSLSFCGLPSNED